MILSTKCFTQDQYQLAHDLGLNVVCDSVLEVEYQAPIPQWHQRSNRMHGFLLASQNTLRALRPYMDTFGDDVPHVAVVGTKTAKLARQMGLEVSLESTSARELAEQVLGQQWQHITFFCGEAHRPELPDALTLAGRQVREVVVYRTHQRDIDHDLDDFDGVLFFSPRGVEAVLKDLTWPAHTQAFAIGPTTATAFHKHTGKEAGFPSEPTVEALLHLVTDYQATNKRT